MTATPSDQSPSESEEAPQATPSEPTPSEPTPPATPETATPETPTPETPTPETTTPEAPAASPSQPDTDSPSGEDDGGDAAAAPSTDESRDDKPAPEQSGESKSGESKSGESKSSENTKQKPDPSAKKKKQKKKPSGPDPVAVMKRIGTTSEAALAYVRDPDPKLSRMARKHREVIITDIPPVTAGALLGPDALCRHFLASAASGRYRDLFFLWDLFKTYPEECKTVLAARQKAQEKAKHKMKVATHLGLLGSADRVAEDIDRAAGLPWRWLKEVLDPLEAAIVQRPAVLAAMMRKTPDAQFQVPSDPDDRWLAEAARMKENGAEVPESIDQMLGAHADRLPATVATLAMAQAQYPDRVPALIDRVDLDAPDIAAMMAWARDHGHSDQLVGRIEQRVVAASQVDRATGLAEWKTWQDRGVQVTMPESLRAPNLDGLDLGRPESAELLKTLVDGGADLDPQAILDEIAADNRMRGEKTFESFVCAGFDNVHLPLALEGNPMVRPETRCPSCQAWTWVRPGLEKRCPRTGCPLREVAPKSEDQTAAEIDAAVASVDATAAPVTAAAPSTSAASPSAPPADRPAPPADRPAPPADRPAPPADRPAPPADQATPAAARPEPPSSPAPVTRQDDVAPTTADPSGSTAVPAQDAPAQDAPVQDAPVQDQETVTATPEESVPTGPTSESADQVAEQTESGAENPAPDAT